MLNSNPKVEDGADHTTGSFYRFPWAAVAGRGKLSHSTGQRIGLLGRNGAGKTTLMRLLIGQEQPDAGEVRFAPGASVSLLPQDVPPDLRGRVFDIVAQGVAMSDSDVADEHEQAWRSRQQVEQILSRMELDAESRFEVLSSGMKRRVLLARSLVSTP